MRRVFKRALVVTAVMMSVAGRPAFASPQTATAKPEAPPPQPLKVTVTISRFEAEKKTASLPFILWVNTGSASSIQMGGEVPIPSTTVKDGAPVSAFTYRSLGTNINCTATALADGLYKVEVSISDSQMFRMPGAGSTQMGPGFQNFRTSTAPLLRDGQSVEFAVATDKTSGEVIRLSVTLNVVK